MASVASICNIALTKLQVDRILVITEDSEPARACNAVYEQLRDDEMASHPWNFATVRDSLALLSSTPSFDYSYAYQKPSDCLRVLYPENKQYSYEVSENKILSNESSLKIRYIKQITDPNSFSPGFIRVLAARLAYELSFALTGSKTLGTTLYAEYKEARRQERSVDSQEGSADSIIESRWVNARNGSTY